MLVVLSLTGVILITLLTLMAYYAEDNEVEGLDLLDDSFNILLRETKLKVSRNR